MIIGPNNLLDCFEETYSKMAEIGSNEFPFRLEMFIKNNGKINVRALLAADLGEFT